MKRKALKELKPMTKPETKAQAKARQIAERAEARKAEISKEWARIFATPIGKAVAPAKGDAIIRAEQDARALVEKLIEQLTAAGNDLNVVAPYPNRLQQQRDVYTAMTRRRALFSSITKLRHDGVYSTALPEPQLRERCPERIETFIERAKEAAAEQYDAFVAKLVKKIGDVTSAELDGSHVWGFSHLTVTKPDGSTEVWRTQQIVNVSVYGLLFNQWPTRKLKGGA